MRLIGLVLFISLTSCAPATKTLDPRPLSTPQPKPVVTPHPTPEPYSACESDLVKAREDVDWYREKWMAFTCDCSDSYDEN